jgi:hypothetical protein
MRRHPIAHLIRESRGSRESEHGARIRVFVYISYLEAHPTTISCWLGRKDSNLQPSDPESAALPLRHSPSFAPPSLFQLPPGVWSRPPGRERQRACNGYLPADHQPALFPAGGTAHGALPPSSEVVADFVTSKLGRLDPVDPLRPRGFYPPWGFFICAGLWPATTSRLATTPG